MDNKLSELSKPVAYVSRSVLNELQHGNRILGRIWRDGCESDSCAPIYSQEHVSALLARAERIDAMLTESVQALKSAEQRIAELEAEAKVWESAATKHLERAEEAEKRLATPVRLSCETHPRCRTQHAKDVRAAGFTVEGDE
ncbi:hypothetical protein FBF86_05435 [Serratia marcescens]|uniref:hypothetical protein n=1 Tax=Serratia marcescens TaxID=615 RepID=UPI0011500A58|nr:hypothetical protein [Serratia marcescens]QDI17452.1 hypothetical protein FBF86_05435 [Serratia marcescens]QDI27195.1 hypothetical protein FG169_05435 [Serratia marcescens]